MPALQHSPADVLRSLLVQLGLGSDWGPGEWPIALAIEPDSPDDVITLTDTAGLKLARRHLDGRVAEYPGVQIRVRSTTHRVGWDKAKDIEVALDEDVYDEAVAVDASSYLVRCVMRPSKLLVNGKETLKSKRSIFTLNVTMDLRQTA